MSQRVPFILLSGDVHEGPLRHGRGRRPGGALLRRLAPLRAARLEGDHVRARAVPQLQGARLQLPRRLPHRAR